MNLDTPSWDEYFYKIAQAVSEKSKDTCPVGAVIVSTEDNDHVIVATGFNGPARGVLDLPERFADQGAAFKEKLRWVCHAEANAIFNAARLGVSPKSCTLYVTKFPCVGCSSAIVQAGLRRVYTLDHETWKNDPFDDGHGTCSMTVLRETGVIVHAPKIFPHLTTGSSESPGDDRMRRVRPSKSEKSDTNAA